MSAFQQAADPTAVQGRRIGAWIVDVIIIVALGFLVSLAFPVGETVLGNECERRGVSDPIFDSDDLDTSDSAETTDSEICFDDGDLIMFSETESAVLNAGNTLWPNLVSFAYVVIVFWIWQGLAGMTPGKALFGLRTVNEDGEAPGILKAFLRWILWIVDAFPYCCVVPLVGGISMLASKGHRRVGDMAAKTYVVGKDAMGAGPIRVPGKDVPPIPVPPGGAAPGTGFAPSPTGTGASWAAPAPAPTPSPATPPPPASFGASTDDAGAAATPTGSGAPDAGGAPGADAQWDPQRNAYIRWDADQGTWLQYDDDAQTWNPI